MNPLNQLPIDPAIVARVDKLAEDCAAETGHMVLVLVMKEDGKAQISLEGVPDSGPLHDLAQDVPRLLSVASFLCRLSDELDKKEPKS